MRSQDRTQSRWLAARTAIALVSTSGVVLLAVACGGSSRSPLTSPTVASAQQSGWLAFSRCMRSNDVSRYPDPDSSGKPPKKSARQLGVSTSEFQSAEIACRHLLPNGGLPASQTEQQQIRA